MFDKTDGPAVIILPAFETSGDRWKVLEEEVKLVDEVVKGACSMCATQAWRARMRECADGGRGLQHDGTSHPMLTIA